MEDTRIKEREKRGREKEGGREREREGERRGGGGKGKCAYHTIVSWHEFVLMTGGFDGLSKSRNECERSENEGLFSGSCLQHSVMTLYLRYMIAIVRT